MVLAVLMWVAATLKTYTESADSDLDFGGGVVHLREENWHTDLNHSGIYNFVDFYAPWCPHCQHFAPVWGVLARNIQASCDNISFFAVNCVDQPSLCAAVTGYPTVAHVSTTGEWLETTMHTGTDEDVLNWITDITPHCSSEDIGSGNTTMFKTVIPVQTVSEQDLAAALFFIPSTLPPLNVEQLANLTSWFSTLHSIFGGEDATGGWDSVVDYFTNLQIGMGINDTVIISEYPGSFLPFGFGHTTKFDVCEGIYHEYPCALWQLLHVVMQRADDTLALGRAIAVRDFVVNFFNCEECRLHFAEAAGDLSSSTISSHHDGVVWIWSIHNSANDRLAPDWGIDPPEDALWPSETDCPDCRRSSSSNDFWNEKDVVLFHCQIYGTDCAHLAVEQIAGIIIGVLVVVALLGICCVYYRKRKRELSVPANGEYRQVNGGINEAFADQEFGVEYDSGFDDRSSVFGL